MWKLWNFSPMGRGHTKGSATYKCTSPTQQGKNVQAYRTNNGVYLYKFQRSRTELYGENKVVPDGE